MSKSTNTNAVVKPGRLRLAVLCLALGIGLGAYGFFDVSLWNEAPSHWWGAPLFTLGAVLLLVGVFCLLGSFASLFDMGKRKGGI